MKDVKKRILVVCPFPEGVAAGQRLKYEQYFDDWNEKGYEVEVSSYMDINMWRIAYEPKHLVGKVLGVIRGHTRRIRDLFRIHRYDVVYVFMYVTPFGTSVFERLTRLLAKKIIFDVEDNILSEQSLPKQYNPNALLRLIKGPWKARYLIKTADHVITSSPFLNDFCLKINNKKCCTYISSSINTDLFLPAQTPFNKPQVVVGWTGTFSSKIYLDMLQDVLVKLAKQVPYKLKVIGNFDYELAGVDLEVVRWTKEKEVEDLQTFDIGIYPLPVDDWVLGKSGLKAIQYMAFGIPTVATAVGTTPMLIRNNENGFLVETDEDWIQSLKKLILNPDLRTRLGSVARKDAVKNYSTFAISSKYASILNNMMSD